MVMGFFFQGTQERVRNSHDKRAISVRAIEVLLQEQSSANGCLPGTDTIKYHSQ